MGDVKSRAVGRARVEELGPRLRLDLGAHTHWLCPPLVSVVEPEGGPVEALVGWGVVTDEGEDRWSPSGWFLPVAGLARLGGAGAEVVGGEEKALRGLLAWFLVASAPAGGWEAEAGGVDGWAGGGCEH